MKRPIIGIVSTRNAEGKLEVSQHYFNSVWEAGGIGVYLGYTTDRKRMREYAQECDGFLFSGGVDIDPMRYGEVKKYDSVEIDPIRDRFEIELYPYVKQAGKPIFGICRGIQLLNVAEGGTLYQHIEGHRQSKPGTETEQKVIVLSGLLHDLTGESELMVNSFHHQNIKKLASTLLADAISEDGYIEAVHMPSHPFCLGVQWHPEIYRESSEAMQKVFSAFIDAARSKES